jgi:hypothetical protein
MSRLLAILLALLGTKLHAAIVVEDSNLSWGPASLGDPDVNYGATVFQDFQARDHTAAFFDYDGTSIRGIGSNLDEGSDWYVVSAGQAFTKQAILEGLAAPLITFGPIFHPAVSLTPGQDVYLGVVTGQGFEPDDRDVFGWVQLRPGGGFPPTLTIIDNAMSYFSQGIIVGTSVVVPEPNGVCLALSSAALLSSLLVRSRQADRLGGRPKPAIAIGHP